jgi:transposase
LDADDAPQGVNFARRNTVYRYFRDWGIDGALDRIHDALYQKCREQAEREASPTAAIIDSQSVKSAEKGGASIDPHGFDAGKKIKGKKRHLLVDTQGLLMKAIVHSAAIQDRDGGVLLLATLLGRFPYLEKLFADSAYQGPIFADALAKILSRVKIEIVKRSDQAKGLRRAAQALDRRANDRLAQPLPKTGQGLGEPQPHSPHVPSLRLHPPHVEKALQSLVDFRVRL